MEYYNFKIKSICLVKDCPITYNLLYSSVNVDRSDHHYQ